MTINGNQEGTGGGLTPQQLAILNSVPQKMNQVRLVTDGSSIRHEGALTPLTFSQIYDLVMDNTKYVYIVMDNNIRFRPSAYDGDAIWFDSSFIEEGKPNIMRCIINSDNRVDITQIVVASEEYVDEHAGGLDPEQEEAVGILTNSSKGMLNTDDLAPRHINRYDFEDGSTRVVNLDGRVILNRYSELYEFKDLEIKELGSVEGQFDYNYPMWSDMSGRVYAGIYNKVDIDSMTSEPINMNTGCYNVQENKHNIFKGQDAVYIYTTEGYQVFDEETQQFGEYQPYSNGMSLDTWSFVLHQIQFGDRLISIYNNQTIEIVEDNGEIHPEVIDNPFDFDSCPFTPEGRRLFYINDTWYYMSEYPWTGIYMLVDGNWDDMVITYPEGDAPYFIGYGVVCDNMIFSYYSSHLFVYNLTDEEKKVTYWTPVENKVVDLESNQNIGGIKYFKDTIQAPTVSTRNIAGSGDNLDINATYDINLDAFNGFVKLPANTLVNGDPAASKSDTIQSRTLTFPGKMKKTYNTIEGSSERQYYFTFNNKLYSDSYTQWVYDGETAVDAPELFPSTYIDFQNNGKAASDRYFLCHNGLYELVDDAFVLRMADSIYESSWIFPYEDTLVNANGGQKLNTSTWEWEEWLGQQISGYMSADRVFELNGVTYSTNEYNLSFFNPDTASFEVYMDYVENGNQYWSNGNHFIHNGHIYVWMAGSWFILDLENRTLIREPDVTLNGDTSSGVFSINGRTYTNENNMLNMLYNVEYTKPEVPAADGTYILKATRVGDQITYTWVPEA